MSICPVGSGLFSQTVTLYRKASEGVLRRVLENCYLSREDLLQTDLGGCRKERKFLLIVPESCLILPGDRVFEGIGPEIGLEQWPGFIPVNVAELMEVSYAKPCYWQGKLCHVEAGGR
ncbi:MAG: hypothetical protein IJW41_01900 [Oscillospiraceae bacterium]|nr:hypothetical protein [Oscillospiraceae bacterium]